jgi:hypothetical protein
MQDLPMIDGGVSADSALAGASAPALVRARAAALEELRGHPRVASWRRDVTKTLLTVLGATVLVLGAGTRLHIVEPGRFRERAFTVLLLFGLQGLGVWGALAPGRSLLRRVVALLGATAAIAIVAGRGAGLSPATPAWACSTSHIAVDLIPLGLILMALGRFAWSLDRSLLAGVAVAATGAIAGELSCARGWTHALLHHVGAGFLIAVACVVVSRARRPQTFAP